MAANPDPTMREITLTMFVAVSVDDADLVLGDGPSRSGVPGSVFFHGPSPCVVRDGIDRIEGPPRHLPIPVPAF